MEIMRSMGIVFEGDYRENVMSSDVYHYVEKYARTAGYAKRGLYCYNFCLNTNPYDYQPSGGINLSKFVNIELESTTHVPQTDPNNVAFNVVCDGAGNVQAVSNKPGWQLYQYGYNMTLFEERYNVLSFVAGDGGMMYAR